MSQLIHKKTHSHDKNVQQTRNRTTLILQSASMEKIHSLHKNQR